MFKMFCPKCQEPVKVQDENDSCPKCGCCEGELEEYEMQDQGYVDVYQMFDPL